MHSISQPPKFATKLNSCLPRLLASNMLYFQGHSNAQFLLPIEILHIITCYSKLITSRLTGWKEVLCICVYELKKEGCVLICNSLFHIVIDEEFFAGPKSLLWISQPDSPGSAAAEHLWKQLFLLRDPTSLHGCNTKQVKTNTQSNNLSLSILSRSTKLFVCFR